MSRYDLERSLHILGPVLGQKLGVNVVIGGQSACTDGQTVYLPALPLGSEAAEILGFGFLIHESNHIRDTDFSIDMGRGFRKSMINRLEDIRIDRLGFKRYPGAVLYHERLIRHLIEQGLVDGADESGDDRAVFENYVYWRLEHEVLRLETCKAHAARCEQLFRERFCRGLATKLDALMFEVEGCSSTADVVLLADRITTMLQEETEAERPDALSESNEAPAKGEPTQSDSGVEDTSELSAGARNRLKEILASDDDTQDMGALVGGALEALARDAGAQSFALPRAERSDHYNGHIGDNLGQFDAQVRQASNALRQRISGLLQAESRSKTRLVSDGCRIDARKLARLRRGELNIFKQRIEGRRNDTAVMVLVDTSGSMLGPAIKVARESSYACALAMQSLPGVAVSVAAFPGERDVIRPVLDFGCRVERTAESFASLGAAGGTPLIEAMLWGSLQLLSQKQPRKILLVVTDGDCSDTRAQPLLRQLDNNGVQTLGIGIGQNLDHLFDQFRIVDQIRILPQAMFELLTRAMTTA